MSQLKVVNLNSGDRRKNQVPPIVHSVRQQSKRQISELLQNLFNNTDDALFEMADRSPSNADQAMYFESMREIRLHRKRVASSFISNFHQGFELIFTSSNDENAPDDNSEEELALLRNDELEVSVAISGMVSKITSQFTISIMELTRRFDHLSKSKSITEKLNPLGPDRLSHMFVEATNSLEMDIRVRIILLKLYERLVMERLGTLYDNANQLMAEAGVLTDIKQKQRRNSQTHSSSTNSTDPASHEQNPGSSDPYRTGAALENIESSPGGFGVIQRLLANVRNDAGGGKPGMQSGNSYRNVAYGHSRGEGSNAFSGGQFSSGNNSSLSANDNPAALISTPELLGFLTAAQSDTTASPIDLNSVPPLLDLRQVLVSHATSIPKDTPIKMGQSDEDVMSIVSMLFDFILNDRSLAIPMKALISRLQIPVVRLAIIDKTFFEKTSHPARQLLNELSSAGIGWSSATELRRDALYNKIESIVLRVLNGFSDDPDIFTQLVSELRNFIKKDSKRHSLVEQRVKEAETGKALTQHAKETVQKLINQKACGLRLPAGVGRFISEIWSKVLVYVCLKQGIDSEEWQLQVQNLDDLLWCLQPLNNLEDLQRRDIRSNDILDEIRRGMCQVNIDEQKVDSSIAELAVLFKETADHDRHYLDEDASPADASVTAITLEPVPAIHLVEADQTTAENALPSPEPKFQELLRQLTEGSWVEMHQQANGSTLRCKLATIIQPGDRYVFVNRRGIKVAETHRMQLAQQLQEGLLVLLEESEVFDRALQAVIGNLRQMQNRPINSTEP